MPEEQVNLLSNLDIDEVSLVDRGANQYAKVELSKRDEEGETEEDVEKASPTPSGMHVDQPLTSRDDEDERKKKRKGYDDVDNPVAPGTQTSPVTGGGGGVTGATGGVIKNEEYGYDEEGRSLAPEDQKKRKDEEKLTKRLGRIFKAAFVDDEVEKFGPNNRRPPNLHPGQAPMGMPEQMPMQMPGGQQGPPDMGLEGGGPDQFGGMGPDQFGGMGMEQEAQMPQGMGGPQDFPGSPGMPPMDPMGGGSFPGQATQDQMGQEPGLAPLPQEVVDYIRELEEQVQQISQGGQNTSEGHNPFGKSEEFTEMPETQQVSLEELAKALEGEEQREIVYKALDLVAEAEERAAEAETIAKAERDNRLGREYIEKARSYTNLPVTPEEFGPVLKRMYESLTEDDVQLIEKALGEKNSDLGRYFSEVGKQGGYAEPVAKFDGAVQEIQKNNPEISYEQAFEKAIEANPSLYDEYESEKGA